MLRIPDSSLDIVIFSNTDNIPLSIAARQIAAIALGEEIQPAAQHGLDYEPDTDIAPLYLAYLRESFYANIAAIYRTYYEPDDIGLALVTTRAELIEANPTAQKFGEQIIKQISARGGHPLIQNGEISPLSAIVRMLTKSQAPVSSSIERTWLLENDRFHCMLKPCMLTGLSTDIAEQLFQDAVYGIL